MIPDIPNTWTKIRDALVGTPDALEHCLESNDLGELEDDTDFLEWLDNEIFRCEDCNWWCEISEESSEDAGREGELVCRDCI